MNVRLTEPVIEATRSRCAAALETNELLGADEFLRRAGIGAEDQQDLVNSVTEVSTSQAAVVRLRDTAADGDQCTGVNLARLLLVRAAIAMMDRGEFSRVAPDVTKLTCREFDNYASPRTPAAPEFKIGHVQFAAACKIATGRRYLAGQFDWEVSGIPRSWFVQPRGREIASLPLYVIRHLGKRGPLFFRHFGVRRPMILRESSADESYYRMAESMRLQPEVRGFAGCGWFSSPDVHAVSPHLAWANRTICEHGGIVIRLKHADPEGGVLARNADRQRLYEEGSFRPRLGLVLWSREAMLAWADKVGVT